MKMTINFEPIECCYLECDNDARWAIVNEDVPDDLGTYSCDEHLGKMLSERNYVVRLGYPVELIASIPEKRTPQ